MNKSQPLVSIGMPVYNGEPYLPLALDSLLKQDYEKFELIISDNASTDKTQEICLEYVARDKRIRYDRNYNNIGAAKNFERVLEKASGHYFMWAAHDDLWEKTYISKCVSKLEENSSALMVCSEIVFINEDGSIRTDMPSDRKNRETLGMDVAARIHKLIAHVDWYEFYGLFRFSALKHTLKQINLVATLEKFGGDVILLMELSLRGEFAKINEPLFFYRSHPQQASLADLKNAKEDRVIKKPYSFLARELLRVVLNSNLDEALKYQIQADFVETLSVQNWEWRERIAREESFLSATDIPPQVVRILIERAIMPKIQADVIIEIVKIPYRVYTKIVNIFYLIRMRLRLRTRIKNIWQRLSYRS